jgi:hypothetical protein
MSSRWARCPGREGLGGEKVKKISSLLDIFHL